MRVPILVQNIYCREKVRLVGLIGRVGGSSGSVGLTDYSQVDMLSGRYNSVRFASYEFTPQLSFTLIDRLFPSWQAGFADQSVNFGSKACPSSRMVRPIHTTTRRRPLTVVGASTIRTVAPPPIAPPWPLPPTTSPSSTAPHSRVQPAAIDPAQRIGRRSCGLAPPSAFSPRSSLRRWCAAPGESLGTNG